MRQVLMKTYDRMPIGAAVTCLVIVSLSVLSAAGARVRPYTPIDSPTILSADSGDNWLAG